jgi:hypothetical protein
MFPEDPYDQEQDPTPNCEHLSIKEKAAGEMVSPSAHPGLQALGATRVHICNILGDESIPPSERVKKFCTGEHEKCPLRSCGSIGALKIGSQAEQILDWNMLRSVTREINKRKGFKKTYSQSLHSLVCKAIGIRIRRWNQPRVTHEQLLKFYFMAVEFSKSQNEHSPKAAHIGRERANADFILRTLVIIEEYLKRCGLIQSPTESQVSS